MRLVEILGGPIVAACLCIADLWGVAALWVTGWLLWVTFSNMTDLTDKEF